MREQVVWREWTLRDAIQAPGRPGVYYAGFFKAVAPSRAQAERTVRMHFALMLHQAGRL